MKAADFLHCPVCHKPETKLARVEASGACCCMHMDPGFRPTREQLAEAEAALASICAKRGSERRAEE